MNVLHDIPTGSDDLSTLHVAVAIPKGSKNKYEFDEDTGVMWLDRVGYSAMVYPGDYGDIPQTLGEDGDALDAIVVVTEPTYPGVMMRCRILGVLHMVDDGEVDDKILCVPDDDPRLEEMQGLDSIPKGTLNEISNFFATYKQLQNKEVNITGWGDAEKAREIITASMKRYQEAGHK